MGNTLRFDNGNDVTRIYDLKGSTFSRQVKGRTNNSSTLKDQNFVSNQHDVQEINMSPQEIEKINTAIRRDTNFLASIQIMDYSILLGIESKVQINSENFEHTVINAGRKQSVRSTAELQRFKRHRFVSPEGMQTYHVSIIDFLQLWNCQKKAEQFAKTTILRANKKQLSAVEPAFYRTRFQKFMRTQVFIQTRLASKDYSSRSFSIGSMAVLQRSGDAVRRTTSLD